MRPGASPSLHPDDGHSPGRRLPVQIPQLALGGRRKSRPRDAEAYVRSPGFSAFWRPVDEPDGVVSQAQADQQHLRQARIRKPKE